MVNMGRNGTADFVANFLNMPIQIILDGGTLRYNNFVNAYKDYLNKEYDIGNK